MSTFDGKLPSHGLIEAVNWYSIVRDDCLEGYRMNAPTPFPISNETGLVGRDRELQILDQIVDDALRNDVSRTVVWCGSPGMGKSALRKAFSERLMDLRMGDERNGRLGKPLALATLQIEMDKSLADCLISLRTQLAATGGYQFLMFDWAFIRWFKLAHPDADIAQRHPNMFSTKGSGAADDILSWINDIGKEHLVEAVHDAVGIVPGLNLIVKYGHRLGGAIGERMRAKKHEPELAHLDSLSEEELFEKLPDLLGDNLQEALTEKRKSGPAAAIIMIDGAEKLQAFEDYRGSGEGWVERLHHSAPSAHLSLFSRSLMALENIEDAQRFGISILSEEDARAYIQSAAGVDDHKMQNAIIVFSNMVPLGLRIACDLWNETIAGRDASSEEVEEQFLERLFTRGREMTFSKIVRDMNTDTINELMLVACIGETTPARIQHLGGRVFGGRVNINMDRLNRHGLVYTLKDGVRALMMDFWRDAFLGAGRHHVVRKEIQRGLSRVYLEECTVEKLQSRHDEARDHFIDLMKAVEFADTWEVEHFALWEPIPHRLIKAGFTDFAHTISEHMKKHREFTQWGDLVIRVDLPDERKMLGEHASACAAAAYLEFGLSGHARFALAERSAFRRSRNIDVAADYWEMAALALPERNIGAFEDSLDNGFDALFRTLDRKLELLDEEFEDFVEGKQTTGSILEKMAPEPYAALQAARRSKGMGDWIAAHRAIDDLRRVTEDALKGAHGYMRIIEELRRALAQCQVEIREALPALYRLPDAIMRHDIQTERFLEIVRIARQTNEIEKIEGDEIWEAREKVANNWASGDQDGMVRVLIRNSIEKELSEPFDTFGRYMSKVVSALMFYDGIDAHEDVLRHCQTFEEKLVQSDYSLSPEPNHLTTGAIYGYYAKALAALDMDEDGRQKKLLRAYTHYYRAPDDNFVPEWQKEHLKEFLDDVVCPELKLIANWVAADPEGKKGYHIMLHHRLDPGEVEQPIQ
jgi:hypothetical protein